jgi:hypothetical protein
MKIIIKLVEKEVPKEDATNLLFMLQGVCNYHKLKVKRMT